MEPKINLNLTGIGFKKPEAAVEKAEKAEETPDALPIIEAKKADADSLQALAIQGISQIARNQHAQDITDCHELAQMLPQELINNVVKYFTPINFASASREALAAFKAIDETGIKGNAEDLFKSKSFAQLDEFFA
jgi:hypothetical protein